MKYRVLAKALLGALVLVQVCALPAAARLDELPVVGGSGVIDEFARSLSSIEHFSYDMVENGGTELARRVALERQRLQMNQLTGQTMVAFQDDVAISDLVK